MGSWDLAEFEDFAVRCLHFHSGVPFFVIFIWDCYFEVFS